MYELVQVGQNTFYVDCPAKMGLYRLNDTEVCLIDSGNDKEAGKKVLKILAAQGWTLKLIINTHSHADHIGGNQLLQQRTACPVYAPGVDLAFTQHPILESSFLYGGCPPKPLRNKFLCAQPSTAQALCPDRLPQGLEMLEINGHSLSMVAIKTDDDVWFLADCLTSDAILDKYHIAFLYDVEAYVASLHKVAALQGALFIPAHAQPTKNILPLVEMNLDKTAEVLALLKSLCAQPITFETILQRVFHHYHLTMDFSQHVLVGSTLRSYLSYLYDRQEMVVTFEDNLLLWQVSNPTKEL